MAAQLHIPQPLEDLINPLAGQEAKGAGAAETAATAVPDFLSRLTSANLWERIGYVALGLLLIAVGVAQLTHAVPAATKIASVVK